MSRRRVGRRPGSDPDVRGHRRRAGEDQLERPQCRAPGNVVESLNGATSLSRSALRYERRVCSDRPKLVQAQRDPAGRRDRIRSAPCASFQARQDGRPSSPRSPLRRRSTEQTSGDHLRHRRQPLSARGYPTAAKRRQTSLARGYPTGAAAMGSIPRLTRPGHRIPLTHDSPKHLPHPGTPAALRLCCRSPPGTGAGSSGVALCDRRDLSTGAR